MKLSDLVTRYVEFRNSLSEKPYAKEYVLRFYCRTLGEATDVESIDEKPVAAFLAGTGPLTRNWHEKYYVLRSFYRYAMTRGYVTRSPLPVVVPKQPPRLTPYIYSREQIRSLLDAASACQRSVHVIEALTLRTIILLLYGAGLRVGEALALNGDDVDLPGSLLTIRQSKFFKSRLVPLGPHLAQALRTYADWRNTAHPADGDACSFFMGRTGKPVVYNTLEGTFKRLRDHTGIRRDDGGRYQPRLHDLRHSFAVHRLLAWYREGADVQQLLPHLSVYLGHAKLASTQIYLTMTPELLQEANLRFERYTRGDIP